MKPILTLLALTCTASADRWRVSWEAQGVGVNFRVCRVEGETYQPLGDTNTTQLVIDAKLGDQISIIAYNDLGTALPSVPITLAAPSGRIYAVTIQASTDTKPHGRT
jgi:hypothetical protein